MTIERLIINQDKINKDIYDLSLDTLSNSNEYEEVRLEHFAAICGTTAIEFAGIFISKLYNGDLEKLIKIEALSDFQSWVENNNLQKHDKEFAIKFQMSLNLEDDVQFYCLCKYDFSYDEPKILILNTEKSTIKKEPEWIKNIKNKYAFCFCDLNTNILE